MRLYPIQSKIHGLVLLSFAAAALMLTGCEKDYNYVAPPATTSTNGGSSNGGTTVSFAADIQPILTANCTSASCHGGTIDPNLTAGNAYSNLIGGGYVTAGDPASSDLYVRITLSSSDPNFMPDGGFPLAADKVSKIFTWIKEGAKNN